MRPSGIEPDSPRLCYNPSKRRISTHSCLEAPQQKLAGSNPAVSEMATWRTNRYTMAAI